MKVVKILSRCILAFTFLLSGLIKANDPLGMVYKMREYFVVWGCDDVSYSLLTIFTIVLASFEFCLGMALVIGDKRVLANAVKIAIVFISLMSLFTLWLALTDAVSDCGCFGDVIVLTNWQTFFKNIILLSICVLLWWKMDNEPCIENVTIFKVADPIMCGFIVALSIISLHHLPRVETSSYKVGTRLNQIETFFVEKDGEDVTEDIASKKGRTYLLVAPYLQDSDEGGMSEYNAIYKMCHKKGYGFYCLTASDEAEMDKWKHNTAAEYQFLYSDDAELKTMVRSNPGILFLENGIIKGKYSKNDLIKIIKNEKKDCSR